MNTTESIADRADATIITDRNGDVAILARHYDDDGIPVVRHRPDPCDFHPVAKWEAMTTEDAAAAVC